MSLFDNLGKNITDIFDNNTAGIITKIGDTIGKYIVRPANAFGLAGFVFDTEGDATVTLSADITDNYTENNSFIQDHIALRPKRIVLKTYVGELVFRQDKNTNTTLQNVSRKLTTLLSYAPTLSKGASQISNLFGGDFFDGITNDAGKLFDSATGGLSDFYYNNVASDAAAFDYFSQQDAASDAMDAFVGPQYDPSFVNGSNISSLLDTPLVDVANIYGSVKNLLPPTTKQQQAYQYFKALYEQKIIVSVQTPFEFMANMAIETVVGVQSEDSRFITDFTITLKEMRFAQTSTVAFDESQYRSPNQSNGDGQKAAFTDAQKPGPIANAVNPALNKAQAAVGLKPNSVKLNAPVINSVEEAQKLLNQSGYSGTIPDLSKFVK